ncbi:MAG: TIGR03790 family protein [Vicinamibacterales bacterium]|nr:TIGR03790 family protein [Vicinamibacterales bacterium]
MRRFLLVPLLAFALAPPAFAQSAANVLLVVNEASAESVTIADYYARARGVPPDQVLRLTLEAADEIDRVSFNTQIHGPISTWLQARGAQDRILYIVLAKGIPLRIKGTAGRAGTMASVDSELTLLYRRLAGQTVAVDGRVENPYFLGTAPPGEARPFTRDAYDIYLVTRLDGFTTKDVAALVDRAMKPSRDGRILLDQKTGAGAEAGDAWLEQAAARLRAAGASERVVLDTTDGVLRDEQNVLGYYSWGSNDPAITTRRLGLGFVPGAVAATFVSTDGRTFAEPPASWTIGKWLDRSGFFAGSPQSLAGDLIREGVTGVAAQVAEPYVDASVRADILFPAYLAGFNLAESFYLSMPYLSWQTVIVGDPLCRPFERRAPGPAEIDRGLDPATELPAVFSARRLAVLTKTTQPDAAKAMLRAEARLARGDRSGGQKALEEATALDAKLVAAHLRLASEYESQGAIDKAVERYRLALASSPDNLLALNNLAYALATRQADPAGALPYAERAMRLSGGRSPEIADTLAWVQHLLGRDREAADILARIVKAEPAQAAYRLHYAAVLAALGRLAEAGAELKEAVRLDPGLEAGDEVKALRAKLGR